MIKQFYKRRPDFFRKSRLLACLKRSLFLFFLFLPSMVNAAVLSRVFVERNNQVQSLVKCQFSGAFQYRFFTLKNPDRVILDLQNTTTRISNVQLPTQGLIRYTRQGHPTPDTLRLVFDVSAPVKIRAQKEGTQLSLYLTKAGSAVSSVSVPATSVSRAVTKTSPSVVQHHPVITKASGRGSRDVVVVIDPGHGGHDPGAIGPQHRQEKQITLGIAKSLKSLIDKQPGMRAILTRNGDYYIGLRERLNIARQHNADIFISIHADAFIHAHSHGASVFALSPRGATSEAARWLAEKENYSELGGVNLKHLDDKNGLIRSVLLDLSQTATISASLEMGREVLQALGRITTLHNHHVEQARFVVLKSPDTPSILVETGFISNPTEAMNLSNARYQMRLSEAIVMGLKRYFWAHPPHGTRLETLSLAPTQNLFQKVASRLA